MTNRVPKDVTILRSVEALKSWRASCRAAGEEIAFVPTMGALHEGHLTLVRTAAHGAREADLHADAQHHENLPDTDGDKPRIRVITSIYVNPTQFAPGEDLDRYPRDFEGDRLRLASVGCDALFFPDNETIYPPGHQTRIHLPDLEHDLCGESRPTHFQGVATVVAILLNLVRPQRAYFGLKDYQQVTLIRRMVRDLAMDVEIVGVPTVREADGLAMSSRNRYLDDAARTRAVALSRALAEADTLFQRGERDVARLEIRARRILQEAGIDRIDYVALRDAETLATIGQIDGRDAVMLIAAHVGSARLIDNRILREPPGAP